ncbi:MAG: hypothetical protein EZS28_055739 [Streblomastix strix]|uniref:Uncharacterized protein n=1 Tax=Streblomastix strix TaxID=222440 RepID=A0A5J4PY05_9EUKA|nr:MAG: hypothetical protein EZS28_055739 [Streblomastix strix]
MEQPFCRRIASFSPNMIQSFPFVGNSQTAANTAEQHESHRVAANIDACREYAAKQSQSYQVTVSHVRNGCISIPLIASREAKLKQ